MREGKLERKRKWKKRRRIEGGIEEGEEMSDLDQSV